MDSGFDAVPFLSYIYWSFLIYVDDSGGTAITCCTQASAGFNYAFPPTPIVIYLDNFKSSEWEGKFYFIFKSLLLFTF